MKTLLFILTTFAILNVNAQNYLIDFKGTVPIDKVIVENITTGDSLTIAGNEILNLKGSSGTTGIDDNRYSSGMKIYPNPMISHSTVEIYPPKAGNATISIYDMLGQQMTQIQTYLEDYKQEFNLTGEGKGMYIISVRGSNYQLSGKLLCTGTRGILNIEKITSNQIIEQKDAKNAIKGTQGVVEMYYIPGNSIKFTAISGDLRTILTDIPDQDKTIIFDLETCVDADKNNYHLVEIGNQTWLEENLKTTKYNDLENIPYSWPLSRTDNSENYITTPGYVWYNDSIKHKEPNGALYNWLVVEKGNLCPAGWHVPTTDEWRSFDDYLLITGTKYSDGTRDVMQSIASKSKWIIPPPDEYRGNILPLYDGNVAKHQEKNNRTGFNAYPSGIRHFFDYFANKGNESAWWSSTRPTYFSIAQNHRDTEPSLRAGSAYKRTGLSVRCIKN